MVPVKQVVARPGTPGDGPAGWPLRRGAGPLLLTILFLGTACESGAPPAADEESERVAASAAEQLIARSVAHHDPEGIWSSFRGELRLREIRPDGGGRTADVSLDVPASGFRYAAAMDGLDVVKVVEDGRCEATVDGRAPDPQTAERLRLSCDQLQRSRNYYLYLWGLPMKLRDEGTIVHPEVLETDFQGRPVLAAKVTYDPEVGSDTWYFYFQPESAEMVGYRFYHDEALGDGEYITLEGRADVGSMRLPARRRWYTNADDRFLGEDVLESARATG